MSKCFYISEANLQKPTLSVKYNANEKNTIIFSKRKCFANALLYKIVHKKNFGQLSNVISYKKGGHGSSRLKKASFLLINTKIVPENNISILLLVNGKLQGFTIQ